MTTSIYKPATMYPKVSENLVQSSLFAKNGLSYQMMNRVYQQSPSIPTFANNAMLHLFSSSELVKCQTVFGHSRTSSAYGTAQGLDQKRVDMIRQMVDQNSFPSPDQWSNCVSAMNAAIKKLQAD